MAENQPARPRRDADVPEQQELATARGPLPDEASPPPAGEQDNRAHQKGQRPEHHKRPSFLRRHPLATILSLVVLVAVVVSAYFVWLVYYHPYETTDDAFIDSRSFPLATKVPGFISDVLVTDNQHVSAGDVILKIDPKDYQIALDQANSQITIAKAAIASAEAQIAAAGAAVEEAKAGVVSASAALQLTQRDNERAQALLSTEAASPQEAQKAAASLRQAQAGLSQAQARVTSASRNETAAQAQRASADASLHQAEAQVEQAEQSLKYTTITAAQPGRVVKLSGSMGQFLQAGQAISMFVPDEVWITANFKETQLTDMRPGQPVDIVMDAYAEQKLQGHVDSIQPGSGTAFSLLPPENATGNYVKVTQRVPVKIVVDHWPKDLAIGPGMSVVPTVTVRPRT